MKKCWEKVIGKSAKKRFLYSHDNHHQKMGGNTRETIFPETTELCEHKLLGKKSSEKSAKQRFLYLHEYREKKWEGGNNARNNFYRRTRIVPAKNVAKKLFEKCAKKFFFIFTRKS